ncbi:uncharacterized protein LOC119734179 [Patiria miniata]|uniref:Uncharacterized protein n=1 Tax=Patiria miniata TaxID=46514 RepID=A0A914AIA8_PATMI|nr:uncharacterized protein LOC119734179 [Patiria miniata]
MPDCQKDKRRDHSSSSRSRHRSRDGTRASSTRKGPSKRSETSRGKKRGKKRARKRKVSKAWNLYGYTADDIPAPEKSSGDVEHSSRQTDPNADERLSRTHQWDEDRTLRPQDCRDESGNCSEVEKLSRDNDGMFDWKRHRRELDAIFFRDDSIIKRKSEDYHDFWKFLERYQAFQFKLSASQPHRDKNDVQDKEKSVKSAVLRLPLIYDNVTLKLRGVEEAERRSKWLTSKKDDEDELTTKRIKKISKVLVTNPFML